MSLKDEIEKLIQAEQEKIESRDKQHANYHQRQRERFVSMQAILKEIAESIGPKYLESRIGDDSARIEIGRKEKSYRSTDAYWNIEPNYHIRFGAASEEGLFYEKPGFKVEETVYYIDDMSEDSKIFSDESEVAEYLIKQITEKVAHYRHLEELEQKRKDGS
jgi:hypothetical protein